MSFRPLQLVLSFVLASVSLLFAASSVHAVVQPVFGFTEGPTLLPGSNTNLTVGARYIYQDVAISSDGILVDAVITIVDISNGSVGVGVGTIDSVNGVDDRFEPKFDTSAAGGYVEWELVFVQDGTIVNASDVGINAYIDSFELEAIDVDGEEFFEVEVTNSYTMEGGLVTPTELVVSNNGSFTRFQSDTDFFSGISEAATEFVVRVSFQNVSVIRFRNGSAIDSDNRLNSMSFLGEVIFDSEATTVINVAPTVVDNTGNVSHIDTVFNLNLLTGASDTDGNIDLSMVELIDPSDAANKGSVSNPLIIPGVGTYTVDAVGTLSFTPVNAYAGSADILFTVSDSLGVSSDRGTLGLTVADIVAPLEPSVDLVDASDTGVSNIDDITSDTTPIIRVTFDQSGTDTDVVVGDVVKLFEGVTQVGSASLVAGDITNGYVDITSSALTAGALSFTATVTDVANNASAVSNVQSVSLDPVAPVIVLNGSTPLTIERAGGYFEIGATASDNFDGDITASIITVNYVDHHVAGTYTVTYDVSDAAGNAAVQVTRTVNVIDTIAPGVSIINQPASVNNLNAFNVTFQFTEIVSGFDITDVSVLNATVSNFINVGGVGDIYTADITPIGAGNISIGVNANVAQDPSANNNTAAVTVITTFDNAPPVLAITGAPDVNIANQSAVVISGTCEVGDGDVSIFLTIGALPMFMTTACVPGDTWSTSFDLSTVTDGTNHIDIGAQQTDGAGNTGSAPFVMISKDTVRPNVQIQNVPGFVNANEFIVTFAFDEAVTGFDSNDISVTNGVINVASFNAVDTQTYTVGVSADGVGDVTLDVSSAVAQDLLGNTNNAATPVVAFFDITAPVVSITVPVTVNAANDDSYMVAGNCDTGDGDVTVSIVGATPSTQDVTCTAGSWTATFDVIAIADGSNALSIDVSQTDMAGNTGNASAQADKDVLISVPTVNVLVTNSTTPVISGTADDGTSNEVVIAGATYTVTATAGDVWTLDTAVATPVSGTFSLIDGSNEVVVTSTDSAGNSDVDISSNEVTLTLDDDNDGIPNSVECPSSPPFDNSCRDTDGDGIPDFQEVDSDNDGIPDASEAGLDSNNPIDSDGDGTPDYRDTDSDNDGINDSLEGVVDTDGDGIPDYLDIGSGNDSDGDGIPDNVECPVFPTDCPDTDGDSSPDYLETDSDNDGIDDAVEAGVDPEMPIDTDGDGTPDYRDTDSDADGTDDATEGLIDNDSDGIPDYVDVITTGPGAGDSDGDGIADDIECTLYPLCADSDADGTPDYMETDSDNDGIADAVETGTVINDADNDGIDDSLDVDITGGLDLDSDGIDDRLPLDTDDDGIPDYRDSDSDNDGIDDVIEGVIDTDADGIPDYLDASNGDASGTDITGSGDSDGDGISDAVECLAGLPCPDVDQDGKPDYMDNNPDDGPGADFDNDGLLNYLDPDDDNDRIPDVVEDPDFDADNNPLTNPLDSDLDSVPDYLDLDSDNDGFSDEVESGASGNDHDNDNIVDHFDIDITGGVDANTDGIDDAAIQLLLDGDSDNLPDYLDVVFDGDRDAADADKDGIPDSVECPVYPTDCPDSDADGAPDFLETDSDGDGLDDGDETGSLSSGILLDTDGDGLPDYQDTDSDGDGNPDAAEGLTTDSDGDGIPDALDADSSGTAFGGDSDGDGVADMDECNSYPDCNDSNDNGTPDYMDASSTPYDANSTINTGLNGVGGNGPWSLLLIITAFVLRRKAFYKS